MVKFEISVNGQQRSIEADEEMPLLWALRDLLGLTGTKYGCGKGLCGACTVHVDGEPIRSCLTPAASLAGRQVTTIEGLEETHPVIQAWIDLDVPQCGYCQPGQIMSASALIAKNNQPNDKQISAAMNGNICRCGTYPKIREAIVKAGALTRAASNT